MVLHFLLIERLLFALGLLPLELEDVRLDALIVIKLQLTVDNRIQA